MPKAYPKELVIVAFRCDMSRSLFYRKIKLSDIGIEEAVRKIAEIIVNGILNHADFFSLRVVKEEASCG